MGVLGTVQLIYLIRLLSEKGLVGPCLIGLIRSGFNHVWIKKRLLLPVCVEEKHNDYIKGICVPGSYDPNPGRTQIDRAALLLHSHQKDMLL